MNNNKLPYFLYTVYVPPQNFSHLSPFRYAHHHEIDSNISLFHLLSVRVIGFHHFILAHSRLFHVSSSLSLSSTSCTVQRSSGVKHPLYPFKSESRMVSTSSPCNPGIYFDSEQVPIVKFS